MVNLAGRRSTISTLFYSIVFILTPTLNLFTPSPFNLSNVNHNKCRLVKRFGSIFDIDDPDQTAPTGAVWTGSTLCTSLHKLVKKKCNIRQTRWHFSDAFLPALRVNLLFYKMRNILTVVCCKQFGPRSGPMVFVSKLFDTDCIPVRIFFKMLIWKKNQQTTIIQNWALAHIVIHILNG